MLFLLLYQPISYLTIFKIQQYQIRDSIKQRITAGIAKDDLVLIKLPNASKEEPGYFSWLMPERELRFHGKMYDIVCEEAQGDTTNYYCILDETETGLFANLSKEVDREMSQSPQREQRRKALERVWTLLFFQSQNDDDIICFSKEPELFDYRFGLKTWITPPPTPPPKV